MDLCGGLPTSDRKAEVTTDTMICENVVLELSKRNALEIACLGYYRGSDGHVRNKLNHRLINAIDGEHKACKGFVRITRTFPAYRMSSRISPAQPSFHPLRYDPGWPTAVYDIAREAMSSFQQLIHQQEWPPMHDLFMTSSEKRMAAEANSKINGSVNSVSVTHTLQQRKRRRVFSES
jgi:hypothetical protein